MSEYIDPLLANYLSAKIAAGATIHGSCRIDPGAEISAETVLEPGVVIGKFVKLVGKVYIERNVTVGELSALFGPLHISENSVIGPGVQVGLVQADTECRETRIMDSCQVGRAVQVLAGLQLGRHSRIRAGSLVTGDVPHYGLASQNPAILERYACPKCGGTLGQTRLVRGAVDTLCEDCGAGEYRFADKFWGNAFNRVLLPNHTFGETVFTMGDDHRWIDEKEMQ